MTLLVNETVWDAYPNVKELFKDKNGTIGYEFFADKIYYSGTTFTCLGMVGAVGKLTHFVTITVICK